MAPGTPWILVRGAARAVDLLLIPVFFEGAYWISRSFPFGVSLFHPTPDAMVYLDNLFAFTAVVACGTVAETIGGTTLGKLIFGLQAVTVDDQPLPGRMAFRRNLLLPVDLFPGFGLVGYSASRRSPVAQRLGDVWAGSRVVRAPRTARGALGALLGVLAGVAVLTASYPIAWPPP